MHFLRPMGTSHPASRKSGLAGAGGKGAQCQAWAGRGPSRRSAAGRVPVRHCPKRTAGDRVGRPTSALGAGVGRTGRVPGRDVAPASQEPNREDVRLQGVEILHTRMEVPGRQLEERSGLRLGGGGLPAFFVNGRQSWSFAGTLTAVDRQPRSLLVPYAGALIGEGHDLSQIRVQALSQGLADIREAKGDGTHLPGCGQPLAGC